MDLLDFLKVSCGANFLEKGLFCVSLFPLFTLLLCYKKHLIQNVRQLITKLNSCMVDTYTKYECIHILQNFCDFECIAISYLMIKMRKPLRCINFYLSVLLCVISQDDFKLQGLLTLFKRFKRVYRLLFYLFKPILPYNMLWNNIKSCSRN